jgi:hypothetical protein
MKDYLGYENARNKVNAELYVKLVKRAFGPDADVLIGHHLCFELGGQINTENEIPSADTLIFDHDVMTTVFGDRALSIMNHLSTIPAESRDEVLGGYWDCLMAEEESRAA